MNDFEYTQRQNPDPVVELARVQLMRDMWQTLPDEQKVRLAERVFTECLPRQDVSRFLDDEIKDAMRRLIAGEIETRKPDYLAKIQSRVEESMQKYTDGFKLRNDFGFYLFEPVLTEVRNRIEKVFEDIKHGRKV